MVSTSQKTRLLLNYIHKSNRCCILFHPVFERIIHNHFWDCQIEKPSLSGDAVRLSGHLAGLSGTLLQMIQIFSHFSQTKLPSSLNNTIIQLDCCLLMLTVDMKIAALWISNNFILKVLTPISFYLDLLQDESFALFACFLLFDSQN